MSSNYYSADKSNYEVSFACSIFIWVVKFGKPIYEPAISSVPRLLRAQEVAFEITKLFVCVCGCVRECVFCHISTS